MRPPLGQVHERQRFERLHGVGRNLGDQGYVLFRRQARNQVVELKHEADVSPPVLG